MSTAVSESLRVVLDTNVLISAFTTRLPGISSQIWQMAIDRRYRLLISPAIVAEAADVLRRKFSWEDEPVLRRLKFLVRTAEMVVPKLALQVVPEDDDDNRILECAAAGNAGLTVSSDRHLRKLESYEGIGIVTPMDFRLILGGSGGRP
jgi:putative PIN family toxin of toxin-antitoxin system